MRSQRRKKLFLKALVEARIHCSIDYFLKTLKETVLWHGPGDVTPLVGARPCFFIAGKPKSGKTCLASRILRLWPEAKVIEQVLTRHDPVYYAATQRVLGCDMVIELEHQQAAGRSSARILKSRWHHCDPKREFWIDLAP